MSTCEICNFETTVGGRSCNICGYDSKLRKIVSEERLRAYHQKLRAEKPWPEEIRFKRKLLSVLNCTGAYLSKALRQSTSLISQDLKLARGLADQPSLSESRNKYEALKKMGQFEAAAFARKSLEETVEYEEQLQNHLCSNWSKTPFADEWRLVKEGCLPNGQYPAGNVGFIDLLAKHRVDNKWLVIELKRNQASDTTVVQGSGLRLTFTYTKQGSNGDLTP